MKAMYITKQGPPEVLTYGELPEPELKPDEVLVRVRACALNHLDVYTRAGVRGTKRELTKPLVLGCDIAGEVARVGSLVRYLQPGVRVLVNPGTSCGQCPACLTGRDNFCRFYETIGSTRDGGYAEYASVPATNVHPLPDWLSFEEAAAIPLCYLTAWHMLVRRAAIRPGETVLVQAAGSGVGSAAIQIAKLFGSRIITTAGTDWKLEKAKELGADAGINYNRENVADRVKELTQGEGVDLVFDSVGETVWEGSVASLKPGGRFINCGVTGGYKASLHMGNMFTRQLTFMGSRMGTRRDLTEVMEAVAQKKLRGVVGRVFDLQKAAEAHTTMEGRDFFGKLVLRV
ncbi:MAG: zinc-binding dehydrogenase [Chloroflexi bacterium]|nr:zinc-binding dehydrogenase [Chloroflexota bacterium]